MIQKIVYITSDKQHFSTSYAVKDYPSSMTENHYHSFYEILYVLDGERIFQIKDKSYILKKGDAVFVNPYDFHRSIDAENPFYARILISFRKELIQDIINDEKFMGLYCFDKNIEFVHFENADKDEIEQILTSLVDEYVFKRPGYEIMIKTLLINFLIKSSRIASKQEQKYHYISDTHRRISEIVRYINSNYEQQLTLENLSKKFFFSPSYLSRTFKNIIGISLKGYIKHVRIQSAQSLLLNTNMSISSIGEKTGFNSLNRFERSFKEVTNTTPLSYRKNKNI